MARMTLNIVTAEREAYSGGADYVVAPSTEGQLTILPRHAALMTTLSTGEVRFRADGGDEQSYALTGGFMEVVADSVTILADAAEHADDINVQRAEEAVERARERMASTSADLDIERAVQSLRRAQIRVKIGSQRRRAPGTRPGAMGGAPPPPMANPPAGPSNAA